QLSGERHRITAVRLYMLAGLPGNERGSSNHARMAQRRDQPVQAVASRTSLVAEVHSLVPGRNPLDQSTHASPRCIALGAIANLPYSPSAIATELRVLATSSPTNTSVECTMARPPALRIGSDRPSHPRSRSVGRATSVPGADIRSYHETKVPCCL